MDKPAHYLLYRIREAALRHHRPCLEVDATQLFFPHPRGGHSRLEFDAHTGGFVRLETLPAGWVDFGDIPQLARFANDWNHDCISPAAIVDYPEVDRVVVRGLSVAVAEHLHTDAQIAAFILPALDNAQAFNECFRKAFPTATAAEGAVVDEPCPTVDVERLQEILPAVGIVKFHFDDQHCLYAWVNGVLVSFVLEPGPTLIVKGFWDPGLPGEEFTRVFLICNDFNRAHTGACAYCHSNPDGLQVRLDVTVSVGAGLSDAQLVTALGHSLHLILHGIDDISSEMVGDSPVLWP